MSKILFYINALARGGAERVMANLSSQFAEHGAEVLFATSYPVEREYPLNPRIKRFNLENRNYKCPRIKRNYIRIKALREICKREKPDVLITFMAEPNFRAIMATIGLPIKTIVSVRNDPEREYAGKIMRFVGKHILPMADGCVFQTEDAKKWFPQKLQKKSTIIFNAVKKDFFKSNRQPIDGLVVTCGRIEEQKNQKMLIKAFEKVIEKYPKAKLEIYGEGSLKEELENLIAELGLQKSIKLMGQTSNVVEVLEKADIFVLPSLYEGMPNALMEAIAVGIPCIATDCPCGGTKMLLKEDNGILIKNNVEELQNAIIYLLMNNEVKIKMGIAAKNSSYKFDMETIFDKWKLYVDSILDYV